MSPQTTKKNLFAKLDTDVVICAATRTPITRAKKGAFKDLCQEDLLFAVFNSVCEQAKCPKKDVEDIQVGNVLPPGGGATVARMAQLAAGFPESSSIATVNRQCSSGLNAVNFIALQIASGQIDVGIGSGVESMTHHYNAATMPETMSEFILGTPAAADCLISMGITSENVAEKWSISRADQDEYAAKSFQKAADAQKSGRFKAEITPVTVPNGDTKVIVSADEGIREGVTAASLGKLKPAFKDNGTTHAGNASQVSDGAAAVLLARRSVAIARGYKIIGKFVTAVTTGVPPNVMGIGPAVAIPRLLAKTGLSKEDVDIYEINEAFASQVLYTIRDLGLPVEKINPNGGAIAFGHPLGCTGARQIATGLHEAARTGKRVLVTSMCIGTGMGMASLIVNEA